MTINKNPMNPVPLWPSKDYWQCRQKTFHDAMAWPVLPNGTLPSMALTLNGTLPTSPALIAVISNATGDMAYLNRIYTTDNQYAINYPDNIPNVEGTNIISLKGNVTGQETAVGTPEVMIVPSANGLFEMFVNLYKNDGTLNEALDVSEVGTNKTQFTAKELKSTNNYQIKVAGVLHTFSLTGIDVLYTGLVDYMLYLYDFNTDQVVWQTSPGRPPALAVEGCYPYHSSSRNAVAWFSHAGPTGTYADGVYYLKMTIDGSDYYSEPFMWLSNLRNYTLVEYRSSQPIVTTDNCITFMAGDTQKSLAMYLPNIPQRPPFQFDVDVTEIDGRKFAEKQVSYRKDHIAFHCYEAFIEAIRLLWHCDIRYIGGTRIDYMEPPEMDWNTDNHLCDVTLEFESDTVMQTNGTASAYGNSSDFNHSAYDNAFDNSFN